MIKISVNEEQKKEVPPAYPTLLKGKHTGDIFLALSPVEGINLTDSFYGDFDFSYSGYLELPTGTTVALTQE